MATKTYIYSFQDESGYAVGHNTEYAETIEQALLQAKARWADSKTLKVKEDSMKEASEDAMQNSLYLFI